MTDLDELERLAAAASSGPWRPSSWKEARFVTKADGVCLWDETGALDGAGEPEMAEADAAFIAASRTAVPELVAEVRRLRRELNQAVLELDMARRDRDRVERERDALLASSTEAL